MSVFDQSVVDEGGAVRVEVVERNGIVWLHTTDEYGRYTRFALDTEQCASLIINLVNARYEANQDE